MSPREQERSLLGLGLLLLAMGLGAAWLLAVLGGCGQFGGPLSPSSTDASPPRRGCAWAVSCLHMQAVVLSCYDGSECLNSRGRWCEAQINTPAGEELYLDYVTCLLRSGCSSAFGQQSRYLTDGFPLWSGDQKQCVAVVEQVSYPQGCLEPTMRCARDG